MASAAALAALGWKPPIATWGGACRPRFRLQPRGPCRWRDTFWDWCKV